jgi:hypothetical protein
VKLVKLWSEDRWGFKDPKSKDPAYLTAALYAPAIAEAHRLGLRTVSHVKTLKDWKDTLRAGGDYITHTVEDVPVDDELLAMIKARGDFANVFALTTELQGGSAARAPGQRPEWLKDPILPSLKCAPFLEKGASHSRRERRRRRTADCGRRTPCGSVRPAAPSSLTYRRRDGPLRSLTAVVALHSVQRP